MNDDEMTAAITEGVRQAFVDVLTGAEHWPFSHERLMQAIRDGVERARFYDQT